MSSKIVKNIVCLCLCLGMEFATVLQAEGVPTGAGSTDTTTETTPEHDVPATTSFWTPYGGGG